jgi:hypothetical protein
MKYKLITGHPSNVNDKLKEMEEVIVKVEPVAGHMDPHKSYKNEVCLLITYK